MDKSCHSSVDSTTSTNSTSSSSNNNNNNTDQYLRHLNKISHKISKPTTARPTFDHLPHRNIPQPPPPPPPLPHHLPPPPPPPQQQQQQQQQQQHQPPVYNIKKSDFRDVVQKLTGSPAHERFTTPPPIQPPKPPSSRLQRIRPPPLAQLSHRPPPLLNNAVPILNPNNNNQRQVAPPPLSPLPPFPSVHAAAESPISAYMRYLQTTTQQQPLLPPPPQHAAAAASASAGHSAFLFPSSPVPFGCFPSPRSPYPLLSPSLLFSPSTAGQLGFQPFPVSPRMPVTSPRWKDL